MLIIFLLQEIIACPIYSCKPTNISFSNDTCIYNADSNYFLSICDSSLYCPITGSGNSSCVVPVPAPAPQSWPGGPCNSTSDCYTGACINNICIGKHWLEKCNSTSECHLGLFCLNSTCWFQRAANEPCSKDTDCKNNMGCFINKFNKPGVCKPYYSLKTAQWVYNCYSYFSSFCESGNCAGPGGKGVCVDPIKPRYLSSKCRTDSDCLGESFGWEFYSECQCGYNSIGQGYCKPFLGDYLGTEYISMLKSWYNSTDLNNCHTEKRMDSACMSNWKSYKEYLLKYYNWRDYALVQNNDECVKNIYTQYYWDLK
jgi:hypothetical protein